MTTKCSCGECDKPVAPSYEDLADDLAVCLASFGSLMVPEFRERVTERLEYISRLNKGGKKS